MTRLPVLRTLVRPTLLRRIVLALLLAFALVWLVQLGAIYWQLADRSAIDRKLRERGDLVLAALEDVHDPAEAARLVDASAQLLNPGTRIRAAAPLFGNPREHAYGPLLLQLTDSGGRQIYPAAPSLPEGKGLYDAPVSGQTYRIYHAGGQQWTLRIGEPRLGSAWLLGRINQEMLSYLAVSFVLILVPIWFAVARGLRPLRQLSDRIAQKHVDDLSPIGFASKYAELQPLTAALDRLLALVGAKVEREASFVQDAAHELRTPLAVISAQAHVLARAAAPDDKAAAEQQLEQAIARASHLIRQLLDLAQADRSNGQPLHKLDAAAITRDEVAAIAPAALERNFDLELEAPQELLFALHEQSFRAILQNLLGNALRYLPAGARLHVNLRLIADAMQLSVADDGAGIPAAERDLVFTRFYRGNGQDASGSGLGLAIARQAATGMGGRLELQAGLDGRGCKFLMHIPSRFSDDD